MQVALAGLAGSAQPTALIQQVQWRNSFLTLHQVLSHSPLPILNKIVSHKDVSLHELGSESELLAWFTQFTGQAERRSSHVHTSDYLPTFDLLGSTSFLHTKKEHFMESLLTAAASGTPPCRCP